MVVKGVLARRSVRHRREAGESLLEVIIAMVIIALAVGPILGTLIESAGASAQHRALATIDTLMKSFAESATSHLELAPATPTLSPNTAVFAECASTYKLISKPSTLKTRAGSAVSVFVTGFPATALLSSFTVTVGGVAATTSTTTIAIQSQQKSDANGNMQITFKVPARPVTTPDPTTPQPITVSDGAVSVTSTKRAGITVSSATPLIKKSPDAHYTMGISSIRYWHPSLNPTPFNTTCHTTTTPSAPLHTGVQLVTLKAALPGNARDTLSFVLRNPIYAPPPKPTPTMTLVGKSISLPTSGSSALVFVATVSVATTPGPTKPITWTVTGPNSPACTPTPPATTAPNTTSETSTCDVPISTTPADVGQYTVTASIASSPNYFGVSGSAVANVYASNGSGTVTVSKSHVVAGSTGDTLTLTYKAASGGMFNGRVEVTVPSGWSAPTTTTGTPGYVSATGGSGRNVVSITGSTVVVTGVTLAGGQTLKISYATASAPTSWGRDTFAAREASTSNGTLASLTASPVVAVVYPVDPVAKASTNSLSLPTFAMPAGAHFLIFAFSSQSGTGDSATPKTTGFGATAPSFTPIGSQQNFGPTSGDHTWAWYTTGTATGGTGTLTVNFAKTAAQAYLEVVQLSGSTSPPVVTATEGLHVATASGTTATASLTGTPASASDPEVIFLAAQGDLGATAPPVATAVPIGFAHTAAGSVALYTGPVRTTQTITIPTNWWAAMGLEIHG